MPAGASGITYDGGLPSTGYDSATGSSPPAERRFQALQQAGGIPDLRDAQITRLKTENTKLKERLAQAKQTIDELTNFRRQTWPSSPPSTRRSSCFASPPRQPAR